ncbi:MAG: proline dehydrogenase family protein [Saprospiraceae bacterium]|nr:proline dehydrogenase family protein [Saprospiraceae bacterium]
MELVGEPKINFKDTEKAFAHKSNRELRRTYMLFKLMNNPTFVRFGSMLGNLAAKLPFHIGDPFIKETIFKQFCGGTNLLECQKMIDKLYSQHALTILDYGVEAKESDDDFQATLNENLKAIELAYSNPNVPVISTKLTGYVPFHVLEKKQAGELLSDYEKLAFEKLEERFVILCTKANELGVGIFIDAEESWIQDPIDELVDKYMPIYNKEKVILYNTFQMYRTKRLEYLKSCHKRAVEMGFYLGAKIVRGAYMEKERKQAQEKNQVDPIQPNKETTDQQYNEALRYCLQHIDRISVCNASHNWKSNELQIQYMQEYNISKEHPHANFCQLMGMSDNLTFNLASQGYCVAKYVPYGPVKDVIPYLTRRAQENSSVSGDMSRELGLLDIEMKRRGLIK